MLIKTPLFVASMIECLSDYSLWMTLIAITIDSSRHSSLIPEYCLRSIESIILRSKLCSFFVNFIKESSIFCVAIMNKSTS